MKARGGRNIMTDNSLSDFIKKNDIPVDGKYTPNTDGCNPFMEAYQRDERVLDSLKVMDPSRYESHKILFDNKWRNK